MELDLVDRKLLYGLDLNCRTPLAVIAKKLRISRNVALYRFERLKKEGIIKGTFTEINLFALGKYSIKVVLKLCNYTKNQEQDLVDHIRNQKGIMWFFKMIGRHDLNFVIALDNIFEFETIEKELMLKFSSIIEEKKVGVLSEIRHYKKDYLVNNKREIQDKILRYKKIDLDEKDHAILRILSNNAMMNIVNIAEKTNLSINTVKKRIKELEDKEAILGYRLFIDTNLMGYKYYKLHLNFRNYNEQDMNNFFGFIGSKNFIIYTDKYFGGDDIEIEMHVASEEQYLDFLKELLDRFGSIIKNKYLLKFYEELAFNYLPD